MKTIQRKIITLLVCCTFFVVVVVAFLGLGVMNQALKQDANQIMQLMCAEQAGELNEYLHSVEQSVDTMYWMALSGFEEYGLELIPKNSDNEQEKARKESLRKEYLNNVKTISGILAENTDGAIAVYYRLNPELFEPTEGFFSIKSKNENFIDYACTDLSLYDKDDKEHVSWYYEPLNAGEAIWMDPYANDNIGVEMISYVVPVYYAGEVIGVIGMDIDIVSWREKVEQISLYDTGFAVLLDSKGNVVYHPDYPKGLVGEEQPEIVGNIYYYVQEALKQTDSYSYQLDARERAMVAAKLDNDMNFAVVVPLQKIMAPSRMLMIQVILLAVVIVILFSLFSVRICKHIISVAYTDVMTGVKNKTAYEETVEGINQEIREKKAEFALAMFDINNLKLTNDTYGHDEGDKLIIVTAALMQKVFGADNVFRIGGDEFVVLLRHEDADGYQKRLEEFGTRLEALNREESFSWGDIKVARGATVYDFHTDAVYGDVFRRADALMYENKKKQKEEEYI